MTTAWAPLGLGQWRKRTHKAYCDKFLNRTIELIDKYGPELDLF
jgi:alpha-L-fucosidase